MNPSLAPIATGSHIDAIPNAGKYDGVVGVLGALMFVGALLAMIYGKATLVNLGIGLVGVVCMVPAGLRLLLGLFGDRSDAER